MILSSVLVLWKLFEEISSFIGEITMSATGDDGKPQKSKAELKAERRAKQEAERAAKAAKKAEGEKGRPSSTKKKNHSVPANIQADNPQVVKKVTKRLEKQQVSRHTDEQKKVSMVVHLHQYDRSSSITQNIGFGDQAIHPAIIRVGLKYSQGIIDESNMRCVALIDALCKLIRDLQVPADKEFARHLESKLKQSINYVEQCRPKSISMGNAIKFLRSKIYNLSADMPEKEAKASLIESLEKFVRVNIELAGRAISKSALDKIRDGDNVLVFGNSSVVGQLLCDAKATGKRFTVTVVDARPKLSGRDMLRVLMDHDIECSYIMITAISQVISRVSKVICGADGIFSNGYVMSSVGLASVAMIAKSRNVPVIICCEVYKFSDHVQTDSFVKNELGDPRDILTPHNADYNKAVLPDCWDNNCLKALNITYDVTPPKYISMVITELNQFPCLSVPAVIRMYNKNASY